MSHRERLVLYGLIALVALGQLAILAGRGTPEAHAAPAIPDDLGPADRVVLAGEKGELGLRAIEGRLAWSEEPTDRVHSVGFVFIGKVISAMMQAEEVVEERQRLAEELGEEEREHQMRLAEIQSRGQALDPERDGDQLQRTFEEWQQAEQAFRQWQQTALARTGKLESEYLERSYRELLDAVNVVADRRNIDLVWRHTPPDAPFETEDPRAAMSTIRLRSALRYPESLDITDAVMKELGLEV